jgi:hypothetical protein
MELLKKLTAQISSPKEFFNSVREEGWKPCFIFYAWVTLFISVVTPILNFFGMESTDISSSYQSQILAYNFVKNNLFPTYGSSAYLSEVVLIFPISLLVLGFLTLLMHAVYRVIGGQGSVLNAWKAVCYGIGPCLFGGFLPYVALFAGFYSFTMQFYLGPMTLYSAKEGRAILVFTSFIAMVFIEMFTTGTTVGV